MLDFNPDWSEWVDRCRGQTAASIILTLEKRI
jgi:hypothetical protein